MTKMTKILATIALIPTLAMGDDSMDHELEWLLGCWVSPDGTAQEVWVLDNNQSIAGFGVGIADNKVVFYEVLTIGRREDGSLILTAHPSGQASASFVATVVTDNSVVFTNADHDYPQEIKYSRQGDRLEATVSLLGGAKPSSFEKVACADGSDPAK
jgi:hypothetical protein